MQVGGPVPDALASSRVLDREGREFDAAELWADGPTLLVFLRHFGCLCASEQVTDLVPRLEELHDLGVRTVFIGNGEARHIARFTERFALSDKQVEIVTDPSLAIFEAAGLVRSVWAAYGPLAIRDMVRATGHGHVTRLGEGDALQQGGTVLIDAAGNVAWYHRNLSKGGHAPTVAIVDAVMRLVLRQTPLPC